MITVKEVETRKEKREFLNFPLKLYRDNPNFVPPLYGDEKKIFRPDYLYYDTSEAVYYNAYRDGVMVGRISGILQKAHNEKTGEKRIRFTRFDTVNDIEVAKALFDKVEAWGREKGMDTLCGPLGFSDLEREGLLVEGFDKLATFEEQYNADYYQDLVEACGLVKEIDWTESMIFPAEVKTDKLDVMSEKLKTRYKLHEGTAKNIREYLDKYADKIFELIDKSYGPLYGTVPITEGVKKMLLDNFRLIIKLKYVGVVLDENENAVCFGLCFPSIAKAVQPSGGRLTPFCLIRLLKAINHPKVIDLALIGVDPEWANRGVSVVISSRMDHMLRDADVVYAETNLNLETNYAIHNQWKRFKAVQHKRRRSYIKKIS